MTFLTRSERWLGPGVVAAAAAAMLTWTWGKWPDVTVDFGKELYVAWQLASGKRLYVDIAHLSGPLSAWLNAAVFRAFGTSLLALVMANLVVLACLLALTYRLSIHLAGRLAATVACLVVVAVFACGHLTRVGNYNFVCPYSHELTHGLALSIASLGCLSAYHRSRSLWPAAGAGFIVGLVLLTKVEVALAAVLSALVGWGFTIRTAAPDGRQALWLAGVVVGAALVPPAAAIVLLGRDMPVSQAMAGIVGDWRLLLDPSVASLLIFRTGIGIDEPGANLWGMALWGSGYAVTIGGAYGAAMVADRIAHPLWAAGGMFALVAGSLLALGSRIEWLDALRPLPLGLLIMMAVAARALIAHGARDIDPAPRDRLIVRLAALTFSLALMAKIVLNVRAYHYGFALTMPAAVMAVLALAHWIPARISRHGGDGRVFQSAALGFVLVFILFHLQVSHVWLAQKTHVVGQGADRFVADGRGAVVNAALDEIARRLKPGETLAALPEGVILNYLSRRSNPTPYVTLMPIELAVFGEDRVIEAFEARPPDYVTLVHSDTSDYGYRFFGRDYGRGLYAWVRARYEEVAVFGAPPLHDHRFGVMLMERREPGTRNQRRPAPSP